MSVSDLPMPDKLQYVDPFPIKTPLTSVDKRKFVGHSTSEPRIIRGGLLVAKLERNY
jgi:hypothetical protein